MANDWIETTLGGIADPCSGAVDGPFGSNLPASSYVAEGIPVIRGSNLSLGNEKFKQYEFVYISQDTFEKLQRSECLPNDIIFTKKGTLGQTGIIPKSSIFKRYLLSSNQMRLRVDPLKALPEYIYYVVSSPKTIEKIKRDSECTGVPKINLDYLRRFPIKLPDLKIQKSIAHILGSLDDKIELNRQMNETLEAMAQALFKSWFVDFDPVIDNALAAGKPIPDELSERAEQRKAMQHGDNQAVRALFPDEFVLTEEMGWIPKGWCSSTLDNLTTELRRGISPKYTESDGVRVINQRCIRDHSIDYSFCRLNDVAVRKVEGRYLDVGDILVNSTGVGTLGRMAQVQYLDEPTVVDSHVTVVRPNKELIKPFTFGRMMLSIEPLVESMGLGSTGQTELSRVHLGELVLCVPPIEVQTFFEKLFSSYSHKSAFNLKKNISLSKLRDTLLPKLLSGELRIPDAAALVEDI